MATTTSITTRCAVCGKDNVAYKCDGCLQRFCFNHLAEHRQELDKQLDYIENERNNIFIQTLSGQTTNSQQHILMQQIKQWEENSIEKIKQIANETRKSVVKLTDGHMEKVKVELKKLTEEMKEIREGNNFNETNLNQLKIKLKKIEKQLNKISNIKIQEDASLFIKKISAIMISPQINIPKISMNAKWKQNGTIIAGTSENGSELKQLHWPWGICLDDNETIYVADQYNHRIIEWKKGATSGQIVAGGNGLGCRNDQLNFPRNVIIDEQNDFLIIADYKNKRVARWPRQNGACGETIISNVACSSLVMDNNNYLYVSDVENDEVRRWKIGEKTGTLVAGGNGKGNRLDQFNGPCQIVVDENDSVYVSDCNNHRVMKWIKGSKQGIVVAGNQGQGNSFVQLSKPYGILVDQFETLYIADSGNHRVMRWPKGAKEGSIAVDGNGYQLYLPTDIAFDEGNNLYIVDNGNNRVQKFSINLSK